MDNEKHFAHFKRHTTPMSEIPRYLQMEKRAWDRKEYKINQKNYITN